MLLTISNLTHKSLFAQEIIQIPTHLIKLSRNDSVQKKEQQNPPRKPYVVNSSNTTTGKPPFTTIGTQTDTSSNIERSKYPLDHNRVKNPFDDPQSDIPILLSKLTKNPQRELHIKSHTA